MRGEHGRCKNYRFLFDFFSSMLVLVVSLDLILDKTNDDHHDYDSDDHDNDYFKKMYCYFLYHDKCHRM